LAVTLPDVLGGAVELRDMLEFCRHCRIKGIASLLLTGASEGFVRELSNSGHAFLHHLTRTGDEGKATSRGMPFFDALAALDLECARNIARTSRMTWNPDREYEDDFLYVHFLMKRFFLDAPQTECDTVLTRWVGLLAGEADVKLELCESLSSGEGEDFHDALCRWLADEADRYTELMNSDAISPEVAATEGCVSVEGLALLRLAESKGFKLEEDYLMIPSLARTRVPITFDPNAWQRT